MPPKFEKKISRKKNTPPPPHSHDCNDALLKYLKRAKVLVLGSTSNLLAPSLSEPSSLPSRGRQAPSLGPEFTAEKNKKKIFLTPKIFKKKMRGF